MYFVNLKYKTDPRLLKIALEYILHTPIYRFLSTTISENIFFLVLDHK